MSKTVTVYSFWRYDPTIGEVRPSHRKATREVIERDKGEIIEDTAEQVDASLVDSHGFYPPIGPTD